MHPLIEDFSLLKNQDLESKINDLTNKYFLTKNVYIREQIITLLNSYKEELFTRQQQELEKSMITKDQDLDKLININ